MSSQEDNVKKAIAARMEGPGVLIDEAGARELYKYYFGSEAGTPHADAPGPKIKRVNHTKQADEATPRASSTSATETKETSRHMVPVSPVDTHTPSTIQSYGFPQRIALWKTAVLMLKSHKRNRQALNLHPWEDCVFHAAAAEKLRSDTETSTYAARPPSDIFADRLTDGD